MAFVVPTIFTVIDRLTAPVRAMGNNVAEYANKTEAVISRSERAFRKLTPSLSDASKQLLSFASTATAVAGIVATGKAVVDYETKLKSLQSITGATDEKFAEFKTQIRSIALETKKSSLDVAEAFESIANNQPELLKDANALALVTKSSIILAKAAKMELQPAGEALTQILNQFGKGAADAAKTIDILAAGSVAGSSEIRDTAEAIQKFGTVAANAGVKIDESVALIELSSKFEKGAEAGQKLRNILITMSTAKVQDPKAVHDMQRLGVNMGIVADKALPLNVRLKEMAKVAKDDAALFHIFGKENQALATGVLNNADAFSDMLEKVRTTGEAQRMAAKNSETFAAKVEELKNKFITWVTTSEEAERALNLLTKAAGWIADNLSTIMKVTGTVVGLFIAWRIALYAARAALFLTNIVIGVNSALTGVSSVALRTNTVALAAQKIALGIATAAQWALNAAMLANPVVWVVAGVLALVAALGYVIANYKSIEDLHKSDMQKRKTEAIKSETEQIYKAAAAYEKYGESKEVAMKKALRDSKQFIIDDIKTLKAQSAKPMSDSERRIMENRLAADEGRLTAVNELEAANGATAINPKLQQAQMLSQTINNNTQKEVIIKVKAEDGTSATTSGLDDVMGKTTSTMPK